MRKSIFAALGLGGLLAVLAAAGLLHRPSPQQPVGGEIAPPPSLAAREITRATAPVGTQEEAAQPAPPAVPDLPTIEVAPRPVHEVPEEAPPPKSDLADRAGRTLAFPGPARDRPRPFVRPAAPVIAGAAEASGGTTLAVAGRPVRLFGVRIAEPGDRCGTASGGRGNCAEAAREALAQRLRRSPRVSCQTPPGQRGNPAAICVDASGTDLGGFLVTEGLALADTSQSYEYFGAEGVARSHRSGLWGHR
ncbi:MAG TPA: hypothetical protein VJR47_03970 [Stellaceae bacterium]|nr:hypothetical protein [Stellaceae bacterium]